VGAKGGIERDQIGLPGGACKQAMSRVKIRDEVDGEQQLLQELGFSGAQHTLMSSPYVADSAMS